MINNADQSLQYYMGSTGNAYVPSGALIRSNGPGGLSIVADSGPIAFGRSSYIGAAEFGRFVNNGNFLLGTMNDNGYKLQVVGQFSLLNGVGTSITTNSNNLLDIVASNTRLQMGAENIVASINNTGFFDLNKNGNSYFRILSHGHVGIGTPAPTSQLHTTGTVRFAGLTNDNSLSRVMVSDINGNLFYRELSSIAMNDNLRSSMAVNGSLTAKRIKITDPGIWPDYVFQTGYTLLSLKEVERYITANEHLPGIPSGAEIQKDGIDVADIQAKLLQKIEELTLYIIAQDKESQQLKKEIKDLNLLNTEMELLKKEMKEMRDWMKTK
jgi:hypothetical protein